MARLNQIIAIEKGIKSKSHADLTTLHQAVQKPQLLSGISRVYQPRDEEGEKFPSESTKVQLTATEVLKAAKNALSNLFDITATKDATNCIAKADVVVDGKVLLTSVPATYLLFLEKQLVDLITFVKKLPTLDPSENWVKDVASGGFATEPTLTVKTKKVMRNHVKVEATEKFPAQVDVYSEDVVVGQWRTTKFSGALPASEVTAMLERTEKLQLAVKFAREEANNVSVTEVKAGAAILGYIFG